MLIRVFILNCKIANICRTLLLARYAVFCLSVISRYGIEMTGHIELVFLARRLSCTYVLHSVVGKFGYLWNFVPNSEKNFNTTSRSCHQQHSSTVEFVNKERLSAKKLCYSRRTARRAVIRNLVNCCTLRTAA